MVPPLTGGHSHCLLPQGRGEMETSSLLSGAPVYVTISETGSRAWTGAGQKHSEGYVR